MQSYTGLDYLKIDVANQFGLDKMQFEDRIYWVGTHTQRLEAQTAHADDPFRYAAAVKAFRDALDCTPTGHLVGLDACASGIQVMSAITGCTVGARNTGLTGDKRMDIYEIATNKMNDLLDIAVSFVRDIVKPAVMTFFYGSL